MHLYPRRCFDPGIVWLNFSQCGWTGSKPDPQLYLISTGWTQHKVPVGIPLFWRFGCWGAGPAYTWCSWELPPLPECRVTGDSPWCLASRAWHSGPVPLPRPGARQPEDTRGQPQPWAFGTSLMMGPDVVPWVGSGSGPWSKPGSGPAPASPPQAWLMPGCHDQPWGPWGTHSPGPCCPLTLSLPFPHGNEA